MIDEVGIDNPSLPAQDGYPPFSVDDELSRLKASKTIIRGSIFSIDFSTARKAGDPRPVSALDDRVSSAAVQKIEESENSKAQNRKQRQYAQKHEGIGGYLLGIGEMIAGGALMATGVMVEIGSLGFLTVAVGFQEAAGFALLTDGFARTMRSANDISFDRSRPPAIWKTSDVYAPDRPLPRDPRTNHPKPETDAPHTELGQEQGRKEKYPQAREFDGDGKWKRDIDFTDHGRPNDHELCPHQHEYIPNPTGGTPERDKIGKPVPEWIYP